MTASHRHLDLYLRSASAAITVGEIIMRILAADEVRQVASYATSRPDISAPVLMRRAGYAVAQFCVSNFKFRSVCVVCGKGNNGADGLAAAAALRGIATEIFVVILAKGMDELG